MTGRDRQTVADMAVEHTGSAEAAFGIVRHNSIASDTEVAGMEFADEPMADRRTADYIRGQGVVPANGFKTEPDVLKDDYNGENVVTEEGETIES